MTGRIELLGIDVDLLDTEEAYDATNKYLMEEGFNLVYLVDTKLCMETDNNLEISQIIDKADIVLPANDSTESSLINVLGHSKGRLSIREYFDKLLTSVEVEGKEVLVITNTKEELEKLLAVLNTKRQYLSARGESLDTIGEGQYELVANTINSIAPDLLILCLDDKVQLEFLKDYRNKINVNLCICTGESFLILWFKKGKKLYTTIMNTFFKNKVKKKIVER